jgi:hypothetical protein
MALRLMFLVGLVSYFNLSLLTKTAREFCVVWLKLFVTAKLVPPLAVCFFVAGCLVLIVVRTGIPALLLVALFS